MRKTSQDGGDSTSITSGIENEIKKSGVIIKTKRNSIKRKVQNFSHESDDAVIEPLLQKDKEKTDIVKPSAKFNLLTKTKTEVTEEKGSDKDKLITDKEQSSGLSNTSDVKDKLAANFHVKDNSVSKSTSANAPIHNHMNTNVFSSHDGLKGYVAPKSQILVEIDNSRQVGYNPSPLIFTTAKIHTDGKTKQMEPVQMTPVPILSTIEVSVIKSGGNTGETSGQVSSNINTGYSTISQNAKSITEQSVKPSLKTMQNKEMDSKILISTEKKSVTTNTPDKMFISSSSNKESSLTQPKSFTTETHKVYETENKNTCKQDQTGIEYPPKTSLSQPPNNTSSNKIKTTLPQELQIGLISLGTTKGNSVNNTAKKEIETNTSPRYPENKSDLNKIVKPDSQRTDVCASVKSVDKANKEYNKTSFNNKQLQRQSVVIDKDGTIPKLKSNMVTSPQSIEGKILNKSGENSISNEADILNDKTKLPRHSAYNVPTTIVTTLPVSASTDGNTFTSANSKKLSQTTSSVPISKTHNADLKKSPTTTTVTCSKTSIPTTANSSIRKTVAPTKTTPTLNNSPAISTQVTTTSSSSTSVNTPITAKTSAPISSSVTSAPLTSFVAGNKISTPVTTIVTTSKFSEDVVTTSTKIPSKTTGTIVDKTCTSSVATNSSGNPITSSSISKMNSPIVKAGTVTTTAVSKPLKTENKTGNASSSVQIKMGTTNDGSREKPQGTGSLTTKPMSSAANTKSAKVLTTVTPSTTSQRTTVTMSPTTAKSTVSKTSSQSSEIGPISSSSKEKPSVAKNNTTVTSSATSGKSASANSTFVSASSSSKSTDANKQKDSKSKELSNGNKSLKA